MEEYLPKIFHHFAERCETKLESLKLHRMKPQHRARGFHFDNVVIVEAKLERYKQPLVFKTVVPNEWDIILVNDTARILLIELTDGLLSVRANAYPFTFGWRTTGSMIVWNEHGLTTFRGEQVSFAQLVDKVLTQSEKERYGLAFNITTTPNESRECVQVNEHLYIELPQPFNTLSPFQQYYVISLREGLRKNLEIGDTTITHIEETLDPITSTIYGVRTVRDLVIYTVETLAPLPLRDLVGSNLKFKRVRMLESVLVQLYLKLQEVVRYQKKQTEIRIADDFLLKSLFVPPLVKQFEYVVLLNPFIELSLKHKLTTMLEWLPYELRDVHRSYLANIDIYDSPDDENVGARLYLCLEAELTEYGLFESV